DPNKIDTAQSLMAPSFAHPFGTDNMGRDILSRLMDGSKTAISLSFSTVAISLTLGSIIGALSGYFGGIIDEVLMRIIDALMAFPGILFAMMLVSVFGPGLFNTVMAIGIMTVPYFSRVVRSGFLQV